MPDDAGRSARTDAGPQFSSFSGAPATSTGAGGGVPSVDTGLGGGAALGEGGRAASVRVREKSVRSTGDSDARVVVQAGEPVSWMFTTSLMFSGSVRLEHLHFSLAPQPYRYAGVPASTVTVPTPHRCMCACVLAFPHLRRPPGPRAPRCLATSSVRLCGAATRALCCRTAATCATWHAMPLMSLHR